MRLNVRRVQPGAVFNSFFGILDIKLGEWAGRQAGRARAVDTH